MFYLDKIKNDYNNSNDLIIKKIKNIYLIYLESLSDQDKINNYILKSLSNKKDYNDISNIIPSPNLKNINNYDDLKLYLDTGFTIIINDNKSYAIETRLNLIRGISETATEASLYGPKDSLTENYQINLGLIKRRIKSNHLKDINITIGKITKNNSSILYLDNIAKLNIVNIIKNKLNKINVDGINDISELNKYLFGDSNFLPNTKITERPDVISNALLNGKIVIIMDNSPYALILPAFLADFINPITDNYNKSININFIKFLRVLCLFISVFIPALYIAVTTYNQETIPTKLLISIQNQRMSVPFPSLIECMLALLVCEILRESDIRFPSNYGSALSILGGLVLGEAAVSAGIISPIMIIVVSITFISNLIFTDLELISALRNFRFIFLIISSFYGLYGLFISFIFFIAYLSSYEILNYPYLYPISPFDLTYIKETLFKMKNNKRSKLLTNNIIKGEK